MILSIKHRIVALTSLALLIIASGFMYIFLRYEAQRIEENTIQKIEILAQKEAAKISSSFDLHINEVKTQVLYFENLIETKQTNREAASNMLRKIVLNKDEICSAWVVFKQNNFDGEDMQYANSSVYDSTGRFICWWHDINQAQITFEPLSNFEQEDWYLEMAKNKNMTLLEPYFYPLQNQKKPMLISFGHPIFQNNKMLGITGNEMNLDYVNKEISEISVFDRDYACLVSKTGIYVSHPIKEKIGHKIAFQTLSDSIQKMLSNGQPVTDRHLSEFIHEEVYDFYTPVHINNIEDPWYLRVSVPIEVVNKEVDRLQKSLTIYLSATILLVLLVLYFLLSYSVKPITRITGLITKLATKGVETAEPMPIKTNDEIGKLTASYNKLLNSLLEKKKIEKNLYSEKDKLSNVMETSPVGITMVNTEGQITYANKRAEEILGLSKDDITQLSYNAAEWKITEYNGDSFPDEKLPFVKVMATGKPVYNVCHAIEWPNGQRKLLSINAAPTSNLSNQDGVITTISDVTEHKIVEKKLAEALDESNLRNKEISALLKASQAIPVAENFKSAARTIFDICTGLLNAKSGYVALLSEDGAENEVLFLEAGGLPCDVDPELPMPIRGLREIAYRLKKAAYENDFPNSKWQKFMPEGHVRLDNVLFSPLIIDNKAVGLIGMANKPGGFNDRDAEIATAFGNLAAVALNYITSHEKLVESEEKFTKAFMRSPSAITISNAKTQKLVEVNNAFEEMFGLTREEVIGKTSVSLKIWDNPQDKQTLLELLKEQEFLTNFKAKGRTKSGKELFANLSSVLIELNGEAHLLSMIIDITEQTIAEQKLTNSEENLKSIVENSTNVFYKHDINHKITYLSPQVKDLLGYDVEEAKKKWNEIVTDSPINKIGFRKSIRAIETGEKQGVYDLEGIHKDGHKIQVEVREAPIVKNGKTVEIVGALIDVTEKRKSEQELLRAKERAEESELQLKLIANSFVNGMLYQVAMLSDTERKFNYVSEAVNKLYGCTPEEAMQNPDLLYGKFHPDDIEGLIEKERQALKNMSVFKTEVRVFNPDGSIRWSYYISKPRIINGVPCWDGIELDITERKQMELDLKEAKEKAEESDRLKTAFLNNMSHEIRTPMNGIIGFSGILARPDNSEEEQRKYAKIISKCSNQLLHIVNDILDVSMIEAGQIKIREKETDLHSFCKGIIELHQLDAEKKGIKLINCGEKCLQQIVLIDVDKLTQVVNNLLNNAIKFTNKGFVQFKCCIKKDEIEFSVSDTGIGIDKELHEKIFDRFRQAELTATRDYGGTGLGLSICKGLIDAMNGKICVQSELGKGSVFYFSIPFKPIVETHKKLLTEPPKAVNDYSNFTILVAEDEKVNYLYIKEILSGLHAQLVHVKNGYDAVEYVKANNQIDIVLMDIKMPVMDGYQATQKIKELNPDIPIIAITAHAFKEDKEKAIHSGCDDYLSKPVDGSLLIECIDKQLIKKRQKKD